MIKERFEIDPKILNSKLIKMTLYPLVIISFLNPCVNASLLKINLF